MNTHTLKTDPILFRETWADKRTFEIRKNDRDYQVGDTLLIKETLHTGDEMRGGAELIYTGFSIKLTVTSILHGKDFPYGLDDDWVVMSTSIDEKFVERHPPNK